MSVIKSYFATAASDAAIPHLRPSVEEVFEEVRTSKELPTREGFRDLRNRVDMLDYNTRELNKSLNVLRAGLKKVLSDVQEANRRTAEAQRLLDSSN